MGAITMTKEEMQALREIMREELEPINKRLDGMESRLDGMESRLDSLEETIAEIKEDTAVTRTAVNALIEWADSVAVVTHVRFPVRQRKAK